MNQISKEALEFMNEAKEGFTKDTELTTYRDTKEGFIALRTGFRDDCIMVYELGNPVGNFTQQLPSQHKVFVDYDDLEMYKKLKEHILPVQIEKVEEMIHNGAAEYVEYNRGFSSALQLVLKALNVVK